MKQVSIIIPHFNSTDLLEKLLLSIPDYKDIEVIVIDDNSTKDIDKLNALKESNSFRHVKFMLNNSGIQSAGACRNLGITEAKGKWIMFADSDDYFLEGFYKEIEKYFDSNFDVIFFNPTSIYIDTEEISNRHLRYRNLVINYLNESSCKNETKLRYEYTVPWSKLIRKTLIDKNDIEFDEVMAWNDIMFSTKLGYYMNDFFVTSEVIYCVTRSTGSLTTTVSNEVMNSRIDVFIRYCNFINSNIPRYQAKNLPITGLGKLLMIFKSGLGFSKVFEIYKMFRRNNIKTIDRNFLNPYYVIKKAVLYFKNHNNEKKYYIK